jgi:hypothetical protein
MASAKGYTADDLIEAFCMGAEYGRNVKKYPLTNSACAQEIPVMPHFLRKSKHAGPSD